MGSWMLRAKPFLSSNLLPLPDNWTPLPEVDYVQYQLIRLLSLATVSPVKCLNFGSSFGPERIS